MALESKELMTVCLRKVTGLSKVKLIDAVWIWTEPHSLRLKIKLTVQKEVINGAVLQQASVVEFVIRNQQCKACEASFAQGNWHAIVQVNYFFFFCCLCRNLFKGLLLIDAQTADWCLLFSWRFFSFLR